MRKVFALISSASVLLITGCATMILMRPAVDDVKTVALVSVYMNRDFYDIAATEAEKSKVSLQTLTRAVAKATKVLDTLDAAFGQKKQQLISYCVQAYDQHLNGAGGWKFIPLSSVLNSTAYKNFIMTVAEAAKSETNKNQEGVIQVGSTIASADYITAPGMQFIPADRLAQSGTHVYSGDAQDPTEVMRNACAKLCKDLRVDAVAIVEMDMGYKKPAISIKFMGYDPAIPNISSAVILINKNGELAVNTGLIQKGKGKRYEGDHVGLLSGGSVSLTDKGLSSYVKAVDKAAAGTGQDLVEAFSKLK
jgi:hypothetical protein